MQKAALTGNKGTGKSSSTSQPAQKPRQFQGQGPKDGRFAQLAAIANQSPQVQAQLKLAEELKSSPAADKCLPQPELVVQPQSVAQPHPVFQSVVQPEAQTKAQLAGHARAELDAQLEPSRQTTQATQATQTTQTKPREKQPLQPRAAVAQRQLNIASGIAEGAGLSDANRDKWGQVVSYLRAMGAQKAFNADVTITVV